MEPDRSESLGLIDLSDSVPLEAPQDASGLDLIDRVERRRTLEPRPDDIDYDEYVFGAAHAAATLATVQVLAAIAVARWFGLTITVQFWLDLVPHLAFTTPHRPRYVDLVTWSMMITGGVTLAAAMWNWFVARHRSREYAAGWRIALPMVALLGVFNLVRHLLDPPSVALWPLAQLMAATAACALVMIGLPSRAERNSQASNTKLKEQN